MQTQNVLINNCEHLDTVQRQPLVNTIGGKIRGEAVTFIPGVNFVEAAVLSELMEKNETFRKKFDYKIQKGRAPEINPERVGKPMLEILTVTAKVKNKDGKEETVEKPLEVVETEASAAKAKMSPVAVVGDIFTKMSNDVAKRVISEVLSAVQCRFWLQVVAGNDEIRNMISFRLGELTEDPTLTTSASHGR